MRVDQAGATEAHARGYVPRSAPRKMEHDPRDRSSSAMKHHAARGASRLGYPDETGCLAPRIALRGASVNRDAARRGWRLRVAE